MEQMPEYKEGHITLWRDGKWVQLTLQEASGIIDSDTQNLQGEEYGTQESSDMSAGA